MTTLNVILFRDGRPGHEKQSQGIVRALSHCVDLRVHTVILEEKRWVASAIDVISFFLNRSTRFCQLPMKPDILIGSGSRTHIPLLSCQKKYGGYAVTCMSPASFLRNRFDLCFVPVHDRIAVKQNIEQTIGPPNMAENRNRHDSTRSMILVGGTDERSHRWDSREMYNSIADLLSFAKDQQWTVSTSPRTPDDMHESLALLADEHTNVWYVPYSRSEPGWIEKQYDIHSHVWVTGDSISMVYEALSAGCSVGIIPVRWKKKDNKFLYSLNYLVENQRVITLNQYLQGKPYHHPSQPLNEADRCAKEIVKRWWPENLP